MKQAETLVAQVPQAELMDERGYQRKDVPAGSDSRYP
jgi:hypothetical protein